MPSVSLPAIGAAVAANAGTIGLVGTAVSAGGAILGGVAAGNAADYQAKVADNNAKIAQQNATYSLQAGEAKTQEAGLAAAEQGGAVKAGLAANNVDVNSGSALDVQAGTREKGTLSEETIANNAELSAYGYQSQATGFEAQSALDTATAQQAPIGAAIGATGSLLSNSSAIGFKWTGSSSSGAPFTNAMNASGSSVAGA